MASRRKTADKTLVYDFTPLYEYILRDRNESSISDKELGMLCRVSERQIRNAREQGMDAYKMDQLCIGYKVHPREVYKGQFITPESLFAADLNEGVITWDEVIEQVKGTFWQDQPIMQALALKNALSNFVRGKVLTDKKRRGKVKA